MDRAHFRHHPLFRPPPPEPMEFLCRSWSVSAPKTITGCGSFADTIHEQISAEAAEEAVVRRLSVMNPFSFASSEASLLLMERIMCQSQSQEVSPRTSGRLSHSSGPLNGGLSCGSLTDSPPVSPPENDKPKFQWPASIPMGGNFKLSVSANATANGGGGKTVGRWLKDRKEKKKEELRAHNAQLHAAVSVAGLASAIAAIAAATAASAPKEDQVAKTDLAMASAATLVAAQCVEAAEAMGAEREHLASVVSSAVSVCSASDVMTLTAAAATALRAAATLKARTLKGNPSGELTPEQNFLGLCNRELLARGCELLKRTRKGDLHWKIVSVYINQLGQVMLKMKSRHVAGTVTKKKKNVVLELVKDIPAWPGRHLLDGGDERSYFGLRTVSRGLVEFECKNQREYQAWTQGIARLLDLAAKDRHRL